MFCTSIIYIYIYIYFDRYYTKLYKYNWKMQYYIMCISLTVYATQKIKMTIKPLQWRLPYNNRAFYQFISNVCAQIY